MLCLLNGVFKVLINQSLDELGEEEVLFPLLKGVVLSKTYIAISEIPEFFGELEPRLKGV
jgi:hypothetical protein